MKLEEHRLNSLSVYCVIFIAGWISCGAWYGNRQLPKLLNDHEHLVQVETKVVPKLKTEVKEANCDKTVAVNVAQRAIASAEGAPIPVPAPSDLRPCPRSGPK